MDIFEGPNRRLKERKWYLGEKNILSSSITERDPIQILKVSLQSSNIQTIVFHFVTYSLHNHYVFINISNVYQLQFFKTYFSTYKCTNPKDNRHLLKGKQWLCLHVFMF